ncbi:MULTISPECIES: hypothetical protein [Burkholderia]|uniref:hypothetical protein n=1 Tax=Burkholderia TaxID=32008 RepID=UPI0006186C39|nr:MULTISPECIES: hypothetical protein [Burkholderia]MBS6359225.1 hypothetical protein [Burkholderia sp.]MDS0805204.1 hypothetical protein [Burkholderia cenocepacia]GLZ73766.1 hypothetical protein Bcon01_68110 [Burkholderia contaminans]
MPARIPLDPKLPRDFDDTPNDARTKEELDAWWDHPFGVTRPDGSIAVRCLDGGAWDRSTSYGIAEDHDKACALAAQKLAEWLKLRERPVVHLDVKPQLVLMPQRPDDEMRVLRTFETTEEASVYMTEHYPRESARSGENGESDGQQA